MNAVKEIPTCCVTGAIAGDGGACGDCDPCLLGEALVPASVKRLISEKNGLLHQLGEIQGKLWNDPASVPNVKPGNMKEFIVAVYRSHSGKVYTFAATYLNGYGLIYQHGCPKDHPYTCEGCEDGCPTTGWFTQTGEEDEGSTFHTMNMTDGDQLMGWQHLPKYDGPIPVPAVA